VKRFFDYSEEEKLQWFGEGEWVKEPDRVLFEHKGIKCLVRRAVGVEEGGSHFGGHLCGYCFLPEGHPWFGKGYDDDVVVAEVHGGITFSDKNSDGDWEIGFDCAHGHDVVPSFGRLFLDTSLPDELKELFKKIAIHTFPSPTYKNIGYVVGECRSLAEQIVAAQRGKTEQTKN
jgi:hypothetical protein